jgi:hypothetical protein
MKNISENLGETVIVSETVDQSILDKNSLVETPEEYLNRIKIQHQVYSQKSKPLKPKRISAGSKKKKPNKRELPVENLPVFSFEILENWSDPLAHPGLFSKEKFDQIFEVQTLEFCNDPTGQFEISFITSLSIANLIWLTKLVALSGEIKHLIKFNGAVENIKLNYMVFKRINMIKNKNGIATCRLFFER